MACCRWFIRYKTPKESIEVKFKWKFKNVPLRKYIRKCCLQKWWPFCSILNVLFWCHAFLTHWGTRQNGRNFADDISKWIFLNENVWIPIKISLKFVPQGPINNIPALVQIMAWRRPGAEPLSGPMMVRLPTHICVTQPQWVNKLLFHLFHFMIKYATFWIFQLR